MFLRFDISPPDRRKPVPAKLLRAAGFPRRYWTATVDLIRPDSARSAVSDYMLDIQQMFEEGMGLLFHGPHGTGKTAAACLVLAEVMSRSANTTYFSMMSQIDWLARNRNSANENGVPYWDILCQAPFVVIDDVGAQRDVDWNDAWFEEVVRSRYHDNCPTILTSNFAPEKLYERYKWLEGVLRDSSTLVEMTSSCR